MTRKPFLLAAVLALTCWFAGSPDSSASDFQSPRITSLGGAGHAGPLLNDSIYLNPSFAAFLPTYSLAASYLNYSGTGPGNPDNHGRNYSVSIHDGRSSLFQAGVAYTVRQDGTFLHVSGATSLFARTGLGLSGKFFFGNPKLLNGQDMTFSFTGVPSKVFQTALIVDNLLETKATLQRGMYREIVLGMKVNIMDILMIYADPHLAPNAPDRFGHEVGLEFVIMRDFFLRMGNFRNANNPQTSTRGNGWGAGLGWIAPKLSLDYGFGRLIGPVSVTTHVIGATIFF